MTSVPGSPKDTHEFCGSEDHEHPRDAQFIEVSQSRLDREQHYADRAHPDSSAAHGHGSPSSTDLTVITPTIIGREVALQECRASVDAQTFPVTQHLIGLDEKRRGPAHVRNHLLDIADTTWALFLDDDDIIYPDYVETVLPYFDESDVVYTWCDKNFDYNTDVPFDGPALYERNVIPVTACVRIDAIREVGGFPVDVAYEDWALWLRLLDIDARFTCVEERKWSYRRGDDGRDAENNERLRRGEIRPL